MADALILSQARIELRDGDRAFRLQIDDLTLNAGEAIALTGASGSGKTLLLELLGLLRQPGQGTKYEWSGPTPVDFAALWRNGSRNAELAEMRGRMFGFVPQTGGLLPFLTVAENIALPQRLQGCEDAKWCRDLLDRLGLAEVADLHPGALSIGQRQRSSIARALSHRPPFVIADEPTAALDSASANSVLELLLDTARGLGSGVILSSHDVDRVTGFGIPRLRLTVSREDDQIVSRVGGGSC